MTRKQRFLAVCSAHSGSESMSKAKTIEHELRRTYRRHFGPKTSLTCVWNEIPAGQAFIAGEPSTATAVPAPVPDDIEQEQREALMRDICDIWQGQVGCSINEIMVTAMNSSAAKRYADISRGRFDSKKSKVLMARIAAGMLRARVRRGYLVTSLNMPK